MRVLLLGSGGREHAIANKVAQSQHCKRLLVAPGNAGTPGERHNVAVTDVQDIVALCAQQHVDLVIIGPEAALDAGNDDKLTGQHALPLAETLLNMANANSYLGNYPKALS